MHAIRQHRFGPAENLVYEQVVDPQAGPGQVRIAVAAAGVHLIDTVIRSGVARGPFPLPTLPMIPGREVAGTVDQVADGVATRWLGQRVVAQLGQASGGYAELAICAVESLHPVPDGLTEEFAVAMIGTGRTALAILDLARIAADDVVLVTAAAGGLGSLLVQAARNAGAIVVGAAGGAVKTERVRQLGASVAVDYTDPEWTRALREELGDRQPTLALDGVGGRLGRDVLEALAPGGRLILFGFSSGEFTPLTAQDVMGRGLTVSSAVGSRLVGRPGGLRALEEEALATAASGRLVPLVGPAFPLDQAAAAHRAMQDRATVGKTILRP
ncbi:MAG: NADPH:quinone reductase [Micromonosporaceae bacterium]|nr:NADPH:quinone reductase [Micromonosporaceae bacterium]